jgi:hypothetical protein
VEWPGFGGKNPGHIFRNMYCSVLFRKVKGCEREREREISVTSCKTMTSRGGDLDTNRDEKVHSVIEIDGIS